jgi:hypothetical protein
MAEFFTFLLVGAFLAAIVMVGALAAGFIIAILAMPFVWLAQVFLNIENEKS